MSARILAYTSPARGHVFPLVPILDELRSRGHHVAVRTLPSEIETLTERGFAARPIARAITDMPHDDWQARTQMSALKRSLATFAARAEHEIADLQQAIDDEHPDALLVDFATWGAAAVAERWGGPWAQWLPFPAPLPSKDAPPFGPGFAPARGPLGRARDALAGPLITRSYERVLLPGLNRARTQAGVPTVGDTTDVLTRAPLLLYMTAEPFEYPRTDWPPNFRLVGPTSWEPPQPAPEWLADLPDPLVLVSTSSEYQDDARIVRCALEGLPPTGVAVVATLPSGDPADFTVPADTRVERFLPHAPLIERAACVICHGGMGITQKALAAGVPVVAIPFGRDQHEVARRVETAGAGVRIPARRLTPARLADATQEAIGMAVGARRVQNGYDAAGGAPRAADEVDALIAAGAARTPVRG